MNLASGVGPRLPDRAWLRGRSKRTARTWARPAPLAHQLLWLSQLGAKIASGSVAQLSPPLHPLSLCWEEKIFLGHLGHLRPRGAGVWAWGSAEGGREACVSLVGRHLGAFSILTGSVGKAWEGSLGGFLVSAPF